MKMRFNPHNIFRFALGVALVILSSVTRSTPARAHLQAARKSAAISRPELVLQTGHAQRVDGIAFSPNNQLIASASADNTVRLWDAVSGLELRILVGHTNYVTTVAFSSDGAMLASGGNDKSVKLWNVATGKTIQTLDAHKSPITRLAFSQDGKTLAVGMSDGAIKFWDAATGGERFTLNAHNGQVTALAFSSDNHTFASGGADRTIKVWNIADTANSKPMVLSGHTDQVTSIAFSTDGKLIASGSADGTVNLWSVNSADKLRTLRRENVKTSEVLSVAFSTNGQTLVAACADNSLSAWDVASGRQTRATNVKTDANSPALQLISAAFSTNGMFVASSTGDKTVAVRDAANGNVKAILKSRVSGIFAAKFSADGKWFASGDRDNTARVWETTTGRETGALTEAGMGYVQSLAFRPSQRTDKNKENQQNVNPNEQLLATGGADGKIRIWDALSGARVKILDGHADGVNALDFSPDGSLLASGGADGKVKIWDFASAREVLNVNGHAGEVNAVAFSPDGNTFVSGGADKTLKVWDARTGKELLTLNGHTKGVYAVAFSPVGNTIASGGADGALKLWDVKTGRELQTLTGHSDWVNSVAFSPDGSKLISGGNDRTIRAWDARSGSLLYTSNAHSDKVDAVTFDPSGQRFASGSEDGSVRVWSASDGALLATLVALNETNDWLVVTPDGLFDGSNAAWNQLLWRFNDNTQNTAPVEAFFNDYYYPGLLADILAGKPTVAPRAIAQRDRRQPRLTLSMLNSNAVVKNENASVKTDDADSINTRNVAIRIEASEANSDAEHPSGSGVRDVRLFRNGSLVRVWRGDVLPRSSSTIVLQTDVAIVAGENRFTAYAFNQDNVKSRDEELRLNGSANLKRNGTLYVLNVGINLYANPQFNLRYAVADATSFGDELQRVQSKIGAYSRIVIVPIQNNEATKANIMQALLRFSGRGENTTARRNTNSPLDVLGRAEPEDAVVIYFAGHGIKYGNRFYLIPHDLGFDGARDAMSVTEARTVLAHSISDRELAVALEQIDAGQTLLVLDACNSGQILESDDRRRGPMNVQGLAQLAYEKGMYILTAAESFQAAQEAARLGHGFLTYALIEEGLKQNAADYAPRDGRVLMREWLDYATARVPQIAEEDFRLKEQKRSSKSNTAGATNGRGLGLALHADVQRPRVFYRRELDGTPLVVARQK